MIFERRYILFSAQESRGEPSNILDHVTQQCVDLVLTAAKVTTFNKVIGLLAPASVGSVQLKRPQQIRHILEVGSDGENLVNHVLHANDAMAAQGGLLEVIGGDGGPFTVNFAES